LITALDHAGGEVANVELVGMDRGRPVRELTVFASSAEHAQRLIEVAQGVPNNTVLEAADRTFRMHEGGKIAIQNRAPVYTYDDLAMAYTPGVARVSLALAADPSLAYKYTIKRNSVAVISDGSAVLGLGDIGPEGAMPVMEGKAMLFKAFADIDAYPICLRTKDVDEIVETVQRIAVGFGGINLEDIAAPRCFEVEERLKATLDIPVFHDDQHGTAIVVLAALLNAVKVTGRRLADMRVVISGAGASGVACAQILHAAGIGDIIACDRKGAIYAGRPDLRDPSKIWLSEHTNAERRAGTLQEVMAGADLFLGLSAPNLITRADLMRMAPEPIVFALANPDPEIRPEEAAGAVRIMATGRSDYPNQINNVLAFPGIFRGALDSGATTVNEAMKLAAARAIASCVTDEELEAGTIIPSVFNTQVVSRVASAVGEAARASGVVRAVVHATLSANPARG
jgi:malate dehydrogenase (oxaloacetate-decarboxylating)